MNRVFSPCAATAPAYLVYNSELRLNHVNSRSLRMDDAIVLGARCAVCFSKHNVINTGNDVTVDKRSFRHDAAGRV